MLQNKNYSLVQVLTDYNTKVFRVSFGYPVEAGNPAGTIALGMNVYTQDLVIDVPFNKLEKGRCVIDSNYNHFCKDIPRMIEELTKLID